MVTITVDPKFKDLNDDPSYKTKPGGVGREIEIVFNLEFGSAEDYTSGGVTLDFKNAAGLRLRQVYLCNIIQGHSGLLTEFVPGSNDDAATGKLKIYGSGSSSGTSVAANGTITLASAVANTFATGTVTLASAQAGDTVTVNGLTYTAVSGTKSNDTEFDISGTDTAAATDLADSIDDDTRTGTEGDVSATSNSDVVTITTDVEGTDGNSVTLVSSNGSRLAVSGSGTFTGGVDADTVTVNGLVYTAVSGSKADDTEFSIDTSDTAAATDLADSIDDDTRVGTTVPAVDVSATSNSDVVTVTATQTGTVGNDIDLASSSGSRLAVSDSTLTGGVDGDIGAFTELNDNDPLTRSKTLKGIIRGVK